MWSKKYIIPSLAIIALFTGCGTGSDRTVSAQTDFMGFSSATEAAITPAKMSKIQPVLGQYQINYVKLDELGYEVSQPMSLTFSLTTINVSGKPQTFVAMRMDSQGPALSNFHETVLLGTRLGMLGQYETFEMTSGGYNLNKDANNKFSYARVGFIVQLATYNGSVVPTQSSIHIKDCGSSRDGYCYGSSSAPDAWFESGSLRR